MLAREPRQITYINQVADDSFVKQILTTTILLWSLIRWPNSFIILCRFVS